MATDFDAIGMRIKEKRKQAGLTQEQLAEKIDVTVGYVSQCERGISKINLEKLSEIAEVLKCDISYFVSGSAIGYDSYLIEEYVEKFLRLTPTQKRNVLGFIDVMLGKDNK